MEFVINNVETFLECDKPFKQAQIALFGAPFDSTTSYRPGTRFGSGAIRRESFGIESYSPYQDKDLIDAQVMDCGDLELCFGNTEKVLEAIEKQTTAIFEAGKLPFMLGGEHLVTLGAFRAAAKAYPDVNIIHMDAHADLRDEYLGVSLSHACVLRRCWELIGDGRIFQFGIRSGDREEFAWGRDHVFTNKFNLDGLEDIVKDLGQKPVYFTVDLDVMDPSVFPGTGTPEPGGTDFLTVMRSVTKVCEKVNLIGCDVNELCPPCDPTGASTAVACKIIREMLIAIAGRINK